MSQPKSENIQNQSDEGLQESPQNHDQQLSDNAQAPSDLKKDRESGQDSELCLEDAADGALEDSSEEMSEDASNECDVPVAMTTPVNVKPMLSAQQRKSRKARRILIVIIVAILALIVVLCVLFYQFMQASQSVVIQQVKEEGAQNAALLNERGEEASDARSHTGPTTEIPNLTNLFGMTQDEAIATLGSGALVSTTTDLNEEGNPVRKRVNIVLTSEPADARSGTPTVYLGLNEEGRTISVGYSAATTALGYGNLSFADAVQNEHIVEETLNAAGLSVAAGAAQLPADRASYCRYASDGVTLIEENCTFAGDAQGNMAHYDWSARLIYSYDAANASGNLADTIRQISIELTRR